MYFVSVLYPHKQSQADLEKIHTLLAEPEVLRLEPSASYRAWIKKTFFLKRTAAGSVVCHKTLHDARPVASKEMMYLVLKYAHASEGHGGRDKTAKAVKRTHSFVRKGLICLFLESCPTCQARTEAFKKQKDNTSQVSSQFLMASRDKLRQFPEEFHEMLHPSPDRRFSMPYPFNAHDPMEQSIIPSYLDVQSLKMPMELAYVPAAPVPRVPSAGSLTMFDQSGSVNGTIFTPLPHLMTPSTPSSFGDLQFQSSGMYPDASSGFVRDDPLGSFGSSSINESVDFLNPFQPDNGFIQSTLALPPPITRYVELDPTLIPFLDSTQNQVFDPSCGNVLHSPISPPILAFNDAQLLQKLFYPQNVTGTSRPMTRHSCY